MRILVIKDNKTQINVLSSMGAILDLIAGYWYARWNQVVRGLISQSWFKVTNHESNQSVPSQISLSSLISPIKYSQVKCDILRSNQAVWVKLVSPTKNHPVLSQISQSWVELDSSDLNVAVLGPIQWFWVSSRWNQVVLVQITWSWFKSGGPHLSEIRWSSLVK